MVWLKMVVHSQLRPRLLVVINQTQDFLTNIIKLRPADRSRNSFIASLVFMSHIYYGNHSMIMLKCEIQLWSESILKPLCFYGFIHNMKSTCRLITWMSLMICDTRSCCADVCPVDVLMTDDNIMFNPLGSLKFRLEFLSVGTKCETHFLRSEVTGVKTSLGSWASVRVRIKLAMSCVKAFFQLANINRFVCLS